MIYAFATFVGFVVGIVACFLALRWVLGEDGAFVRGSGMAGRRLDEAGWSAEKTGSFD